MADITKCSNNLCPIKDKCYRHEAISGVRQSYQHFNFHKNADGTTGCSHLYRFKNNTP